MMTRFDFITSNSSFYLSSFVLFPLFLLLNSFLSLDTLTSSSVLFFSFTFSLYVKVEWFEMKPFSPSEFVDFSISRQFHQSSHTLYYLIFILDFIFYHFSYFQTILSRFHPCNYFTTFILTIFSLVVLISSTIYSHHRVLCLFFENCNCCFTL